MRIIIGILAIIFLLVLCLFFWGVLSLGNPMLISWEKPVTKWGEPRWCLLNPFRDKTPEELTEQMLSKLSKGEVHEFQKLAGDNFLLFEKENSIREWRLASRRDKEGQVVLFYLVSRDGLKNLSPVWITVDKNNSGWSVSKYNAVY